MGGLDGAKPKAILQLLAPDYPELTLLVRMTLSLPKFEDDAPATACPLPRCRPRRGGGAATEECSP